MEYENSFVEHGTIFDDCAEEVEHGNGNKNCNEYDNGRERQQMGSHTGVEGNERRNREAR